MATTKNTIVRKTLVNPWGSSLDELETWDPRGAELLLRVGSDPWHSGVLPRKEVELLSLALHCACTNLDEAGTRRHIRAALDAGATRDELLVVLKSGGVALAIHSCSLGAPILLAEMKAAGMTPPSLSKPATPACDALRAKGDWNAAWDPFYELAPRWTDALFAFADTIYRSPVTPRFMELLCIALDASITHMYAPGVRRHVKRALQAGATPEEIMAVLQLCVSMGIETCAMSVPILAEELARR